MRVSDHAIYTVRLRMKKWGFGDGGGPVHTEESTVHIVGPKQDQDAVRAFINRRYSTARIEPEILSMDYQNLDAILELHPYA